MEIKKVGEVGCGLMGSGITQVCAQNFIVLFPQTVLMSIMLDRKTLTHAPSPNGMPGGYPCSFRL